LKSLDRNDVDISKLFAWGKQFEIEYRGKKFSVWMKLLGDAELNRARIAALRKSAETRKALRSESSDENLAYLPSFEGTTKDEIINGILLSMTKEYTTDAFRELRFDLPKEPHSEASLEEREQYQAEIDDFPKKREKAIREYVENKLQGKREELNEKTKEELYNDLISSVINQICELEMLKKFREMCVFFGSYKDKNYTTRIFESLEQFENIPSEVKEQLIENYSALDIDIEELKK
jgi:hypothetical protein